MGADTLVRTDKEIVALAAYLKPWPMIAVDTEFIRESTFFPQVEIIQIATLEQIFLVDAHAFRKTRSADNPSDYDPAIEPLLEIFRDPSILKIMHAAHGDQECLLTSFDTLADPLFDTAVGASLCGFGDSSGLGRLLADIMDVHIDKGLARTNWSQRPLPQTLMQYAADDVRYLVALAEKLLQQLEESGRHAWAMTLSEVGRDVYAYRSDEIAARMLRGRVQEQAFDALRGLLGWRESKARSLNVPRRWVSEDAVLLDLAKARPKTLEQMETFRGLSKHILRDKAVVCGLLQVEKTQAPRATHVRPASEDEQLALEFLKCGMQLLAMKHSIGARHLISSDKLLAFVRAHLTTLEEVVREGFLSQESATIIGQDLLNLYLGHSTLGLRNKKLEVLHAE